MAFTRAVGAKRLADLRALPVAALQKPAWAPHPIVDGHLLREDLTTTYRNHRQNDVPLLAPLDGTVVPLTDVDDAAFADGSLGRGVAFGGACDIFSTAPPSPHFAAIPLRLTAKRSSA